MTKSQAVAGMWFDGNILRPTTIMLRYSFDQKGSTISLSNEQNLMLQVDWEDVQELVSDARHPQS